MPLIDSTYFVDEIQIAGLENTVDSTGSKVSGFINKYETRYLKEILGEDLYNAFIAGLEEEPVLPKWTALLNQLVDITTKESPIANYVYYYYSRNKATETVGIGEMKPNTENGSMASAVQKQVRAWNEMVDWNFEIAEFISENESDYGPFKWNNCHFHDDDILNVIGLKCKTELFRKKNTLGL